jgi:hypothetical protein
MMGKIEKPDLFSIVSDSKHLTTGLTATPLFIPNPWLFSLKYWNSQHPHALAVFQKL